MPALAPRRATAAGGRALPRPLADGLVVGFAAAALGYGLHHLPPLSSHPALGVAIALVATGVVATALGRIAAPRRRSGLPTLVVAPTADERARPLRRGDLDFCAALHADALPHGFFVELGPRFLRSYYATFLDSPHAVALLASVGGHPAGALVGVLSPRAHARWVLRRRAVTLALRGAASMALRPRPALRFLKTRLGRYAASWRRHATGSASGGADEPAVLSHVAVVAGARGTGAGRRLVRSFEREARRAGARRAVLSTLEGHEGAGAFYARLGWRRSGSHATADGRRMEEWTRDLHEHGDR